MMKALFLIFILAFQVHAQSKRNKHLEKVLANELHLLNKLINKTRDKNPDLYYRKLELYAELLKVTKDKENQVFIKTTEVQRKGKKKDDFFVKSKSIYDDAQNLGKYILKRFPHYKKKGPVYYTMAINARDYNNGTITEKYLKLAIKNARNNTSLIYASYASLADYYYNNKEFKRAIPIYKKVLRNTRDDWNTKYRYNYTWCLVKEKRYDEAVEEAKRTFYDSKNKMYIDMKDQVLGNIGLFYALNKRVDEGIEFYIKETQRPVQYLLKMSKHLSVRGLFELAESTLHKSFPQSKDILETWDIHYELIELYKEFKSMEKFHNSVVAMRDIFNNLQKTKNKIDEARVESFLIALTNYTREVQLLYTKKIYSFSENEQNKMMEHLITYFNTLSEIDPKEKANYFYQLGNIYSQGEKYEKGMETHYVSLELSIKKKDIVNVEKSLKAVLAILGLTADDQKFQNKYLEKTYLTYLRFFPQGEYADNIYQKLFKIYFDGKSYVKANNIVDRYHANYPQKRDLQKSLLVSIIDKFIETKQTSNLNSWINVLRKSPLKIEVSFIEKTEAVLGQLLFNDTHKLIEAKKYNLAIKQSIKLFHEEKYPAKIRGQSGHLASELFWRQNKLSESYEWFVKSWPMVEDIKRDAAVATLFNVSSSYYEQFQIEDSLKAFDTLVDLTCGMKHKLREKSYRNSIYFRFTAGNVKDAIKVMSKTKCPIEGKSKIDDELSDLMFSFLKKIPTPDVIEKFVEFKKYDSKYTQYFADDLFLRFQMGIIKSDEKDLLLDLLKRKNLKDSTERLKLVKVFEKFEDYSEDYYDDYEKSAEIIPEKWDIKEFESNINRLLLFATKHQENLQKFQEVDDPYLRVRASMILRNHYYKIADVIMDQNISYIPKDLRKQLQVQLSQMADQFKAQALGLDQDIKKVVIKNEMIMRDGVSIWSHEFPQVRIGQLQNGVIVDKY